MKQRHPVQGDADEENVAVGFRKRRQGRVDVQRRLTRDELSCLRADRCERRNGMVATDTVRTLQKDPRKRPHRSVDVVRGRVEDAMTSGIVHRAVFVVGAVALRTKVWWRYDAEDPV